MELRPYQQQAKDAIFSEWENGIKKTLLVLPTGCGKTIVFAKVAEECVKGGSRVLILAHRGELLDQAADKIGKSTGLGCATEKAEQTCLGSWFRIVVGSVQSMMREKRLNQFPNDYFNTIIIDEAHHCISDSYQKVLRHFPDAEVLGVTATPDRGDMQNLGTVFESLAYEYTLPKAIKEGYLSPIKAVTIPLKIDMSAVGVQAGDFKSGDIATALDPYLESIAEEMEKYCSNKKTVVFLPLVKTSQKFRDILNNHGFKAAEVNGDSKDRAEILEAFDKDQYNVLCNSMLLTEGWDCPSVDCIVVLRPTKVRSLYCQMVGRGTRLSPETNKDHLLLLDFLWHTERHELPDTESLESVWDDLPALAPPLIENVLRQGHKMLIAGPSKAGKSFALIELCIAIAEGRKWFGWNCSQGRVLYVNLELDRASCLHRFKDVYEALGWSAKNLSNIDIWNLRGKSIPMDKLAPKLIRRAAKKNYMAIIIDPIYKVITGDENSADQMANFCNQFDKVCNELGCAVIYCHHHSKGSQGGKRSMDRASGSGVFARDPDAMLDLIELDVTDDLRKQEQNKTVCATCQTYLDSHFGWEDDLSQDDLCSQVQMMNYCREHLSPMQMRELQKQIDTNLITTNTKTAWRIDGTLREFPKFKPVNLWFDYPIHHADQSGALDDVQPEDEKPNWKKGQEARKKQGEVQRKNKQAKVDMAIESFRFEHHDTYPTVKELYEQIKSNSEAVGEKYPAEKTLWNSLKKYGYTTDKETKRIIPLP